MGKDSYFLVYIPGNDGIDEAEQAFRDAGMTVTRDGDQLEVRWSKGPSMHVGVNAEAWVAVEAEEAAERYDVPELASCARRFEVAFGDLQEVLDDINTLIEVQATLQSLTKGHALLSWNGALIPPD